MANDPTWRLAEVPGFELTSPDFSQGDTLPRWSRSAEAGGEDRSPMLHWNGAPSGTRSFALTMYDPDAPTGSGWWHWAVCNIPATITALQQDAGNPEARLLPPGTTTVANELGAKRYQGAAPPAGHGEHRYFFTLSALDVERLEPPEGCTAAVLGFMIDQHVVARAQLMGVSETAG